mmetsp:Transcript_11591/g.31224  ORF Transcript_11591/g.31224 Transcript_11591/m.31224 type:complete len:148 (-) Transcript_11591:89-532(-)|eukprot:CAMPEP_0185835682 /NCGR_PEP_ID=MMETSP1353-20130828/8234_1 /TAXON_ID=1077150 /ORGANISM="Erythrolobus australicus, Strain CCMP3124" /LENGTH=147 /DNA_ID=CAMNT_0028534349 /DNA_START=136 /DNA_END=579 /DNA_ORIENTATION=+
MGCVLGSEKGAERGRRGERGERVAWDGHVREAAAWSVEPAITTEQLERLRREFWETRIEGREEMWQALRAAAEADSDELRDEFVKAAGIRPASRTATLLSCYDERGALYEVPIYCLRAPENLDAEPACAEFKEAARAVQMLAQKNKS